MSEQRFRHSPARPTLSSAATLVTIALMAVAPLPLYCQSHGFEPVGHTASTALDVSGSMELERGQTVLGNGSTVTARSQPVVIDLRRGGDVRLCPTTSLHLAKDSSIHDPASTALMLAFDRGAFETHYSVGKYSDVLLTPDLRILISGPGEANLSIRVNSQGDTCIANHGAKAPYVTVSSQLEGGAYRVMPNQRVIFEHGSLSEVVDRAQEPCGCPAEPPVNMASKASSAHPGKGGQPVGGPSSTPEDTRFPLAESQGLAPLPSRPAQPAVPGQVYVQVTVPFVYDGQHPPALPPAKYPQVAEAKAPAEPAAATVQEPEARHPAPKGGPWHGFFRSIGHFFSHTFGG